MILRLSRCCCFRPLREGGQKHPSGADHTRGYRGIRSRPPAGRDEHAYSHVDEYARPGSAAHFSHIVPGVGVHPERSGTGIYARQWQLLVRGCAFTAHYRSWRNEDIHLAVGGGIDFRPAGTSTRFLQVVLRIRRAPGRQLLRDRFPMHHRGALIECSDKRHATSRDCHASTFLLFVLLMAVRRSCPGRAHAKSAARTTGSSAGADTMTCRGNPHRLHQAPDSRSTSPSPTAGNTDLARRARNGRRAVLGRSMFLVTIATRNGAYSSSRSIRASSDREYPDVLATRVHGADI